MMDLLNGQDFVLLPALMSHEESPASTLKVRQAVEVLSKIGWDHGAFPYFTRNSLNFCPVEERTEFKGHWSLMEWHELDKGIAVVPFGHVIAFSKEGIPRQIDRFVNTRNAFGKLKLERGLIATNGSIDYIVPMDSAWHKIQLGG